MTTRGIAVTGASGNVGGAVVRGLLSAGRSDVIALVRRPSGPADLQRVVDVRRADYQSRGDLEAVLNGVGTLVFVSSDGAAAAMLVQHRNVLEAAVAAGVEHVVYLSILDLEAESSWTKVSPCWTGIDEYEPDGVGVPLTGRRSALGGAWHPSTRFAGGGPVRRRRRPSRCPRPSRSSRGWRGRGRRSHE
ncbi:SDR family oxidoreductase [Streptomyces uncialis]|uniref:SDR family oxidoreductase n=1 Tax=Streptomyces uncialis TaxID=1048205 RepID=UPI0037F471C1